MPRVMCENSHVNILWHVLQYLRTVKGAYVHINCISINIWHSKLNFSWTHGSINLGFVTMTTMMFPNSVNINNLLSWQLINSSHARVNKLFVPINTAKCGTEDIAWELSHFSHYYYWSWSNKPGGMKQQSFLALLYNGKYVKIGD